MAPIRRRGVGRVGGVRGSPQPRVFFARPSGEKGEEDGVRWILAVQSAHGPKAALENVRRWARPPPRRPRKNVRARSNKVVAQDQDHLVILAGELGYRNSQLRSRSFTMIR